MWSAAKVREKSFTPDGVEPVGGSVECPKDGYALAGGAFWREPPSSKPVQPEAAGFPTLSASIPTVEGDGLVRPRHQQPGRNPDDSRPLLEGRAFQRLPNRLDRPSTPMTATPPAAARSATRATSRSPAARAGLRASAKKNPSTQSLGLLASNAIGEDRRSWYSDGLDVLDGDPTDDSHRQVDPLPAKQADRQDRGHGRQHCRRATTTR